MTDTLTPKKRSEIMSKVRSRNNKGTELALLHILRSNKISGWRRHQSLHGKPDFIFQEHRLAIFVDGCFWHGCPRCYRRPASHQKYWDNKVKTNILRDIKNTKELKKAGWRVLRFWEHEIQHNLKACLRKIKSKF